ncbi:HNH endonuclease [Ureibacillus chungkukjangi]|uniref:HNH endonuclease n=1 Tax=Ureibacillus chungkukjangi TaxID=1202712 RepID=UPI00203C0C82|nr:HNH endonuclease [Ureibacillus chungkukjangi]MCM3387283.1 HNH endonuclease [Ureibacillus chungkukjangi]
MWQQNNKDKIRGYNKYREQNKKHDINKEEWKACKEYFDNSCAYCGLHHDHHYRMWSGELKKMDLHKEHVDHNGSNNLSNCVPACQSCNSSKYNFELHDWYNKDNPDFTQEKFDKIHKWLETDYKKYIMNKQIATFNKTLILL